MTSRRDFVKIATWAGLGLACHGIDGPRCNPRMVNVPLPPEPGGFLPNPDRVVWVVTDYSGPQKGTKDQPFAITPSGWDAFMGGIAAQGGSWQINAPSHYLTKGSLQWGPVIPPWRLGDNCRIDFQGSGILELDTTAIPDENLLDVPIHLIFPSEGFSNGLTPEEAWKKVPIGQAVKNGRLILNHSKMVDRAQGLGKKLLLSGALLQGHGAAIENINLEDCGSWGQEAFPLMICGAMSGPDRHVLSFLDPATHIFDDESFGYPRTHISGVVFDKYNSAASNNQVSVCVITTSIGSQVILDPWAEVGPWTHLYRRNPYISDCTGYVRDKDANSNSCQLTTVYQNLGGEITRCHTENFQAGSYQDYYRGFDLDVHHNTFLQCLRGVAQLLSPTALGAPGLSETFYSRGLKIRSNYISVISTGVPWHGGILLLKFGDAPPLQKIENVLVDDNDVVMLGTPGNENVAVRAERIDGLTINSSNRFKGFARDTSIRFSTGVKEPKNFCLEVEKWKRRKSK